jgi:hypothetical protein
MRFALSLLLVVALAAPVRAQEASPATAPVRRVLIVGDQLAGGMGAGLIRMAENDSTIEVINRFNETSGLARPEVYDWAASIPKIVEGRNFTSAFVLIGFNDRRELRDGDKVLKFGTPDWDALYKKRVDAVLDVLAAQHIQVFWMGEPPVGDPAMDADLQNITALQKDRVAAKSASFIELRSPFVNPQGGYTDRGPDETGTERRIRESDGVTFFKQGNNRLGQIALAALKSGAAPLAQPAAVATAVAPVSALPATAVPVEDQGPLFGQEGVDTVAVTQGSKEIAAGIEQDKAVKEAAAASSIGVGAAKGSNAEALFTTGITAAPPAGRFDDFNLPAAAGN